MYSASALARTPAAVASGSRSVWRSFRVNSGSPSAAGPWVAGTTSSASQRAKPSSAAMASSAARRSSGSSSATSGSPEAAASACATASRAREPTPPMRFAATSAWSRATASGRMAARHLTGLVQQARDALEPPEHRRQPRRQRREVAGQQRVQPAAHLVDPRQRAPGLLDELGLAESERVQLAAHEVQVDPLVRRQGGAVDRGDHALPAVDERDPGRCAGLAHVAPLVVEPVVADGGGHLRLEREQLLEEAGDEVVERGQAGTSGERWAATSPATRVEAPSLPSAAVRSASWVSS